MFCLEPQSSFKKCTWIDRLMRVDDCIEPYLAKYAHFVIRIDNQITKAIITVHIQLSINFCPNLNEVFVPSSNTIRLLLYFSFFKLTTIYKCIANEWVWNTFQTIIYHVIIKLLLLWVQKYTSLHLVKLNYVAYDSRISYIYIKLEHMLICTCLEEQ